jgi:PadR family transcriptional regulator
LEIGILRSCCDAGESGVHGFAIAKAVANAGDSRALTATGTLYRALHRLEADGLIDSWWEDQREAIGAGRPSRRFYRITGQGAAALVRALVDTSEAPMLSLRDPGIAT